MAATHALLIGDRAACGRRPDNLTKDPDLVTCEDCKAAERADLAAAAAA